MSTKRKRAKQIVARMGHEQMDAHRKSSRESAVVKRVSRDEHILYTLKQSKRNTKLSVDLVRQILDPKIDVNLDTVGITGKNHPYGSLEKLYAALFWDDATKLQQEAPGQKAFRALCLRVAEVNKGLLGRAITSDLTFAHILANLARQHEHWIRDLDSWNPKIRNVHKLLSSLLRHLLVEYSVPFCMDALYNIRPLAAGAAEEVVAHDMFMLFHRVGQGGNLRKLLADKIPLTKKMAHLLMTTTGREDFFPSVRRAQILALGGDQRLIRAVNTTNVGRGMSSIEHETFYLTLFQWFINNPMIDLRQFGPLLDYIHHMRRLNAEFSITGRSPNRLYEDMVTWHRELQNDGRFEDLPPVFTSSGLKVGEFETLEKGKKVLWSITEILNPRDLKAEGRRMKHCIFSYATSIARGHCSIWRMSRYRELVDEHERCVTIEVNRATSISQVRGKCNRMPTAGEKQILAKWATQNNLSGRYY